jgi:hypothetical protein
MKYNPLNQDAGTTGVTADDYSRQSEVGVDLNPNDLTAVPHLGAFRDSDGDLWVEAVETKGGRPPHRWFILHRTGGVWSTFEGDRAAAEAECDRLNETDEQGSTTIQAGFDTLKECEAEFYRLND